MGYLLGVRYRPMRLFPTMTTSLNMRQVLLVLQRTLWLWKTGVNRQTSKIYVARPFFSFHLLRVTVILAFFRKDQAEIP